MAVPDVTDLFVREDSPSSRRGAHRRCVWWEGRARWSVKPELGSGGEGGVDAQRWSAAPVVSTRRAVEAGHVVDSGNCLRKLKTVWKDLVLLSLVVVLRFRCLCVSRSRFHPKQKIC